MARTSTQPWLAADSRVAMQLRAVRSCCGTVCFAALGAHFGTLSPIILERLVDGRTGYFTAAGDLSFSGKFRRWLKGARPSDTTIRHILALTKGAVDLAEWRDLDLWRLLAPGPLLQGALLVPLHTYAGPILEILSGDGDGPTTRFDITRDQILALRSTQSLDAFRLLLRVARMRELDGCAADHALAAVCVLETFPYVLHRNPPLRFRWEGLFGCVVRILGRNVFGSGEPFDFPREYIERALVALDADPNAALPFSPYRDRTAA